MMGWWSVGWFWSAWKWGRVLWNESFVLLPFLFLLGFLKGFGEIRLLLLLFVVSFYFTSNLFQLSQFLLSWLNLFYSNCCHSMTFQVGTFICLSVCLSLTHIYIFSTFILSHLFIFTFVHILFLLLLASLRLISCSIHKLPYHCNTHLLSSCVFISFTWLSIVFFNSETNKQASNVNVNNWVIEKNNKRIKAEWKIRSQTIIDLSLTCEVI